MDKFSAIIIEDSESTVELIAQSFEELENVELLGYAVNGKDGYDAIIEHKPDIITLDIHMPVMDGLDLLKKIREENIPVKILVISGVLDDDTLKEVQNLNPDGYLEKPFQPAFIRESINALINPTKTTQKNSIKAPKNSGDKWRNEDGSYSLSFEPNEFDFQKNGEKSDFKPLRVTGTVKGNKIPVKETLTKRVDEKDLIYTPLLKNSDKSEELEETSEEVVKEDSIKTPYKPVNERSYEENRADDNLVSKNEPDEELLKEFFNEGESVQENKNILPDEDEIEFDLSDASDVDSDFDYDGNKEEKEEIVDYSRNTEDTVEISAEENDDFEDNFKEDIENDLEENFEEPFNEVLNEDTDKNIDIETSKKNDIKFVFTDNTEKKEPEEVPESDFEEKFEAYLSDIRKEKESLENITASHRVVNDKESLFTAPINVSLEKELADKPLDDFDDDNDMFNEDTIEVAVKPPRIDFNQFNVKEEKEKQYDHAPEINDFEMPEEEIEEKTLDKVTNKAQGFFERVQEWLKK